MAYTTDTNTKIVRFLSRAGTKLSELSKFIADRVGKRKVYSSYQFEAELGYELACFVDALDNNYNTWTEGQILRFIQYWDNRARLTNYPFIQRQRFNLRIIFPGDTTTSSSPVWDDSSTWIDANNWNE